PCWPTPPAGSNNRRQTKRKKARRGAPSLLRGSAAERRAILREPRACPLSRFRRLGFAIARRACRRERIEQPSGGGGLFVDRTVERRLVRLRGAGEPAQLADELQRRGADFILARGRLEIEQRADVSAHGELRGIAFSGQDAAPRHPSYGSSI